MKILLTNDDGFNAPGIQILYKTLQPHHEIILIAPDREKSAASHGITLNEPMRINKIQLKGGTKGYTVTGTPADCIKLGLFEIFTTPPDLVISGINPGCNIGIDINYSGTVAAAREAALNGISGMAVSIKLGEVMDFEGMSDFVVNLINKEIDNELPSGTFLNINAPAISLDEVCGVKITRQASDNLSTQFDKRLDPKNRPYYWYSNANHAGDGPDTDAYALSQKYISITPIQCDLTDHKTKAKLESYPLISDHKSFKI